MNDEDALFALIFLIAFAGLVAFVTKGKGSSAQKLKTLNPNLIQDKDVTLKKVLSEVESYIPKLSDKLKYGYTETSIENDLARFLQEKFQSVERQHGIGGNRRGDIDVGCGQVGIELKTARQLQNPKDRDALRGQMQTYAEHYKSPSKVILVIIGEELDRRNVKIREIEEYYRSKGFEFDFISTDKP